MVERLEIAVEIHSVITCRDTCRELAFCRRILHHKIHRTADTVAFHVCGKRFGHLQTVKHFRRKYVKRNKTVFVIRAWNFHPINQGIIVTLVHTTKNGILTFSATVAFYRYTRHTLDNIRHRDIRRKLDGFCAHHVHHIHCFTLNGTRSRLTSSGICSHYRDLAQQYVIACQWDFYIGIFRSHLHLVILITDISADNRERRTVYRKAETTVKPRHCTFRRFFFHYYRGSDNLFTCLCIFDFTFQVHRTCASSYCQQSQAQNHSLFHTISFPVCF